MAEIKKSETVTIFKKESHKDSKVRLRYYGIDKEEEKKFNLMEKIKISPEQLQEIKNQLGNPRWLGVEDGIKDSK